MRTGITDDFDGPARSATTPDQGTDEGLFRLGPPLPVELTAFDTTRRGSDAALTWATASEQNNRGFEVQTSTDGHAFQPLAFVAGAGSSSAPTATPTPTARPAKPGCATTACAR